MSRVQTLTVAVAGVALLAPSATSAAESVHLRPSRTEARRVAAGPAAGSALPTVLAHVAVPHRGRVEPVARDGTREVLTRGAGPGGAATPGPATPGPDGSGTATSNATASDAATTTGSATPAPTDSDSSPSGSGPSAPATPEPVTAADLLARVSGCAPVSQGRYRKDRGRAATVPVCGTREAVYWKADMDIDCDGRPGRHCNAATDPHFSSSTAFAQSDGRALSSEKLPYVVVPAPSSLWDYREHGVRGGSVAAVVYRDRVSYAVVGDTGPADIIGEASYAAAKSLGIDPDPRSGGTPSGVTYIVFKDSRVTPLEGREAAKTQGERLAREFVDSAD
ncbi:glycoside hydrolase family 75 protein [Streptomyces sp. DSM 41972]|uniref:Glycoside hydrolase family 75 protein n=1 Tax=Streptomyces althioticus subsp. attaecolombicae TaxID=3075534 RepID=A0ABU3I0I0_9ACTN|nr:glycoside hydrolase family 75 protein [Streptomyces sp. DSM 41972]SCD48598.1 chitosanase of glycosyl hydrolase group 75 [Streptomyces sp. di188]SCD51228.1 chitosanase of glycosyl hydrolase group 75 [Streptomyces sp. di50b]